MCCLDIFELNLTDRSLLAVASVCSLGKLCRALTRIIDTVAGFSFAHRSTDACSIIALQLLSVNKAMRPPKVC